MSHTHGSVEDAKRYAAFCAGVNPDTTQFISDDSLKVQSMASMLLGEQGAETFGEVKDQQQGFRFKNENDIEVGIVIEPFRDGFCVWGVILESGQAVRL